MSLFHSVNHLRALSSQPSVQGYNLASEQPDTLTPICLCTVELYLALACFKATQTAAMLLALTGRASAKQCYNTEPKFCFSLDKIKIPAEGI